MLRRGIPEWIPISRGTITTDVFKVYEAEKMKLRDLLNNVERVSLTTDLCSDHQKVEYMVLTCHFVDRNWKLQMRILSFVRMALPRRGKNIANCIFKCLNEWDIESKVFTVSVDSASGNDTCIQIMKDTFSRLERLIFYGALFHVRCCAHVLNIMVQHGLKHVKTIIQNVHGSRVIDTYQSNVKAETVEKLLCVSDWCRCTYGFKKNSTGGKSEDTPDDIIIPDP